MLWASIVFIKSEAQAGVELSAAIANDIIMVTLWVLPVKCKAQGNTKEAILRKYSRQGPWKPLDIHGYPWISMDIHGYPWISIDIHGYPWISMDIHGIHGFHGIHGVHGFHGFHGSHGYIHGFHGIQGIHG